MADAALTGWAAAQNVERVTIGSAAQQPDYPKKSAFALHFLTDTPWGLMIWDGNSWQEMCVGLDPTGDAVVPPQHAGKPIHLNRITIGALAQRPVYPADSDQALHFLTATAWPLSYWNGDTWADVFLSNTPDADAVLQAYKVTEGIKRITAGIVTTRPAYWAGAPAALHFATATPWGMSFFNGTAWADISKYSTP